MRNIWSVIKGPIITEKALLMKVDFESYGRKGTEKPLLSFRVDPAATKPETRNTNVRRLIIPSSVR